MVQIKRVKLNLVYSASCHGSSDGSFSVLPGMSSRLTMILGSIKGDGWIDSPHLCVSGYTVDKILTEGQFIASKIFWNILVRTDFYKYILAKHKERKKDFRSFQTKKKGQWTDLIKAKLATINIYIH